MRTLQRGLYAITDPALIAAENFTAQIEAAIAGGAVLIQYRDKRGTIRATRFRGNTCPSGARINSFPTSGTMPR